MAGSAAGSPEIVPVQRADGRAWIAGRALAAEPRGATERSMPVTDSLDRGTGGITLRACRLECGSEPSRVGLGAMCTRFPIHGAALKSLAHVGLAAEPGLGLIELVEERLLWSRFGL